MARAKARRRARAGGAQRDEMMVRQIVTPEARAQGDYAAVAIQVTRGEFDGQTHGSMRVVKNRGGTTVERWQARGDLSLAQLEAITLYSRAWHLWIGEQRVTANWSMVANLRGGTLGFDHFVATKLRAKELLAHLDEAVFFALPLHYFETWQNVILFDEAAGVAGARHGYKNERAEAAAKAIVIMIADMIAVDLRLGPAH